MRKLKGSLSGIDFFSNDYLGFARNPHLIARIDRLWQEKALPLGATGSRLLSGDSDYYQEVEHYLADIFRGEDALLFNSGYLANLAVLSALPGRGDIVFIDEKSHACIKDGIRLSLAKHYTFPHNDVQALERKILQNHNENQIFIVIESLYSMDGDEANLEGLVALAEKYQAILIVDEAHSTAIMGKNGAGFCVEKGLNNRVDIRIQTFGKGLGSHGAAVISSKAIKEYLINTARPFIFTTALPPHAVLQIQEACRWMSAAHEERYVLNQRISYFLDKANKHLVHSKHLHLIPSRSAIQGLVTSNSERAKNLSNYLQSNGLIALPILSPTVPAGTERLRICLHAFNSEAEIDQLIELIDLFEIHE